MAKKDNAEPNANNISNKDILQRLNFLYQASTYLNSLGGTHFEPSGAMSMKGEVNTGLDVAKSSEPQLKQSATDGASSTRKRGRNQKATTNDLARDYVKSMKIIGQKTTVKIDPSVKRTICKKCNTILVPGLTAIVRVRPFPSHGHVVSYTCTYCSTSRRIPAPPVSLSPSIWSSDGREKAADKGKEKADIDLVLDTTPGITAEKKQTTQAKRNKTRAGRQKRRIGVRSKPFFEWDCHVTFAGTEKVESNADDL